MVREVIAAIFLTLGMVVFGISVLGIFRFRYVLNRMHAAALADTLGTLLVIIGLMILGLDAFHILKLVMVIIFLWMTSPVTSHMIAKVEMLTNEKFEERMGEK